MRLLERWLSELLPTQRILDLGCGAGSLRAQLAGLNVVGVDVDPKELARNPDLASVCAESHRIPLHLSEQKWESVRWSAEVMPMVGGKRA